jgi:hypothetical protein
MGKMTGASGEGRRSGRTVLKSGLKTGELLLGKGVKKGLEKHDGFTQAGVQVVMNGVEQFPLAIVWEGVADGKFFSRGNEAGVELVDEIRENGDLV